MTREQLEQVRHAIDDAIGSLGVVGDALVLGKEKDAQAGLIRAGEVLKKCKDMLATVRAD